MANGNFAGGTGTELDPYLIEDVEDFRAISSNTSAAYLIVNDIDFQGVNLHFADFFGYDISFSGILDGGGNSLINVNILSEQIYASIFYDLFSADVKNISFDGEITVGSSDNAYYLSLLSHRSRGSTNVTNIKVKKEVTFFESGNETGTSVYLSLGATLVYNSCNFDSFIYNGFTFQSNREALNIYAGGLHVRDIQTLETAYLRKSGNIGKITINIPNGRVVYLGSLVARPEKRNDYFENYNIGDIEVTASTVGKIGGLYGDVQRNSYIRDNFNSGDIIVTAQEVDYVGGLSAWGNISSNSYYRIDYVNCYNLGDIYLNTPDTTVKAFGIGYSSLVASNTINFGSVYSSNPTITETVFFPTLEQVAANPNNLRYWENSLFYDNTGTPTSPTNVLGTEQLTVTFDQNFFSTEMGFDFTNIWKTDPSLNDGYPVQLGYIQAFVIIEGILKIGGKVVLFSNEESIFRIMTSEGIKYGVLSETPTNTRFYTSQGIKYLQEQ